tara:strand:+ start:461 stop:1030 length:570 start_codon:yes stop_codon:yes gene_type:complete
MWPLFLISIISLTCIFERINYWWKLRNINKKSLMYLIDFYSNGMIEAKSKKRSNIPLEKVLIETNKILKNSESEVNLALKISIQSIQPEFDRFNNLFSTIITISPLIGLLGTVIGLINSFSFIQLGNSGVNSEQVTGGISEALISTATGLIIAIFTLIFFNYFNSLRKKHNSILNEYCGRYELSICKKN